MTDWHGQKAAETMRVPPVEGLKTPIGLHLGHVERLPMRGDPSYPSLVEAQRFGGIICPHCVVRKGSGLQSLCGMVDDPKRHDWGLHKRRCSQGNFPEDVLEVQRRGDQLTQAGEGLEAGHLRLLALFRPLALSDLCVQVGVDLEDG